MKRYIGSNDIGMRANPTRNTQEKVLKVLREAREPCSVSSIAQKSGTSYYQTKAVITFFEGLGLLKVVVSSGNSTLVIPLDEK